MSTDAEHPVIHLKMNHRVFDSSQKIFRV